MKIRKMGLGFALAATLAMGAGLDAAPARQPKPQNAGTAGVPVQMTVTVEGHYGNEAPRIAPQDVMVSQGRRHPQVTGWVPAQGAQAGLQLLLLLDDSSRTSLGSHRSSFLQFVASQPPSTQIGVGYMHDGTVEMRQNFTDERGAAAQAFRLPLGAAVGAASPYFSILDLTKRWTLDPTHPRREIVLISDGIDPYSGGEAEDPYVDQAVAAVQRAGIQVFTIYMPGGGAFGARRGPEFWGENYLAQLAEQSGGQPLYDGYVAPVSLAPFLEDMSQILNRQYLLTFVAEPGKKTELQGVKVTTPSAKLVAPEQVEVPGAGVD